MRQRRLLWRIYLYFFVSTIAALAITALYATRSLRQFHQDQVANDLLVRARMVASEVAAYPLDTEPARIDRLCKDLGRLTMTRITVVLPSGEVIGDSDEDPARMENHRNRPEIAAAMEGRTGKSVRFSDTVHRTLMYLAIPVLHDGAVAAVVRTSMPLAVIDWLCARFIATFSSAGPSSPFSSPSLRCTSRAESRGLWKTCGMSRRDWRAAN